MLYSFFLLGLHLLISLSALTPMERSSLDPLRAAVAAVAIHQKLISHANPLVFFHYISHLHAVYLALTVLQFWKKDTTSRCRHYTTARHALASRYGVDAHPQAANARAQAARDGHLAGSGIAMRCEIAGTMNSKSVETRRTWLHRGLGGVVQKTH